MIFLQGAQNLKLRHCTRGAVSAVGHYDDEKLGNSRRFELAT